jgi:lipopolysaccharide export system permease protein
MKISRLKIFDYYIIKKFLGTFFFAIILIMGIAIVFDFAEKLDDFLEKEAPLKAIIFDYYLNFVPYFAVLFSPLFTFIAVIFFTSKMAYNTEIIAMFSSGFSFFRMLIPYFISALVIAVFTFGLNNFVIPHANRIRLEFEEMYYRDHPVRYTQKNIHKQVYPNVYIYMESYSNLANRGYKFSIEEFDENGQLLSKLMSDYIFWDSTINKWVVRNYYIRTIDGLEEKIETGARLDTTLTIFPEDFAMRESIVSTMNLSELNNFIDLQKLQGADNIEVYLIERYSRYADPFSTFILTIIGLTLSSRKIKGGIGMQIGAGLFLSFSYIFFMQFSKQFSIGGNVNPLLAVWIPNILYAIIGVLLFRYAPK